MRTPLERYTSIRFDPGTHFGLMSRLNRFNEFERTVPDLELLIREYEYALRLRKMDAEDNEFEIYTQIFNASLPSQFLIIWNISILKRLIQENTLPTTTMSVRSAYDLLNEESVRETEEEHFQSLSPTKLEEPILIVPVASISGTTHIVVDGHHRIVKKYRENTDQMVNVIWVPEWISVDSIDSGYKNVYKVVASMKSTVEYLEGISDSYTLYRYNKPDRRNELCFCGSGRKYKHCHDGQDSYLQTRH